ncbi:ABC transporter permease [Massilia sp. TS11]|uniref:ABC transporter permease n=1 Tax=Massilia sp. TS11 TaxID=2908003 RepID=UPI001EDACE2A|nr:ABC transporter permease [Massilia sp. TS11]MCG2583697.1 ABC transporter permease [Massilia sp. TS11]
MYIFLEAVRSAMAAIRAHRLRSFLTSLGIIIGVASVITVISLIQGLSKSVTKQFEGLGGNALTVHAKNDFKDVMRGKFNYLRFEDVEQLRGHVDSIRELSPVFAFGAGDVRYGTQSATTRQQVAVTPSYMAVNGRYPRLGRFISESDDQAARRVCVIGEKLIENLHLPENPVGEFIQFSGEWFKIIGVMEKRGEVFGMSQDEYVLVPFKTGQALIGNARLPQLSITAAVDDIARVEETKARITTVMRQSHRLRADDKDDFEIESSDSFVKSFETLSSTVTLVMAGVVGIALLVGGIGIMNIMLVSVTERTREIGICKAIGARSRDILMQFLIEAVTLSVLGGLIGLAIGYGLGMGIAKMIPDFPDAYVPWWAIALSFLFSAGVGVIFGVLPARKAANLDPIEALRYE